MKKTFLILSLISITLFSCDKADFGDINQNAFIASQGDADALLRGAIVNYTTLSGRNYNSNVTLYAQYQSQTQYTDEQRYNETPGFWGAYYTSLNNLKEVNNYTTDIRGNTANLNATAEIFSVLIWKRITDTFGDIPYTEALQGEGLPTPAYSSQESVYKDLIVRAKAARDMFDDDAFPLNADTDIIYGGNINLWRKFANSLIMNLALQMSNRFPAPAGEAAVAFKEALENDFGVLEANADNAVFTPDVDGSVVNPFSRSRAADFTLSKQFTDALQGETGAASLNRTSNTTLDNRINIFSSNPTGDGLPYGYGNNSAFSGDAIMADTLVSPAANMVLLSSAYTYLNRAEAATLGWTAEDAMAMLTSGITNSFAQWGVDGAAAYSAARVTNAGTVGAAQVIGEEKWVALFPSGFDGWTEQRKTGFPNLLPSPEPLNSGVIPTRFIYPNEETTINPTNWAAGVATLSPGEDKNSSKIWWDN